MLIKPKKFFKKVVNCSKLVFVIDGEWEHLSDSSQTTSETRLD